MLHAEGVVPPLDTPQLDAAHGPVLVHAEARLAEYRPLWSGMDKNALWEEPYCAEASNCFRLGTDADGNAYIAVSGQEDHYITDSAEALRTLIREIKAGRADHLL